MKVILILFLCLVAISCNQSTPSDELIKQVRETELLFDKYAQEVGLKNAFLKYADDQAVLARNNKIIKGKEAIAAYFDAGDFSNIVLTWKPDFVEVAISGDLAYTYGNYRYTKIDSTGHKSMNSGIFHTVWKKQADGTWKFVYD